MAPPAKAVTVALDWTPNTNHAGFFIAKAMGLYADAGLDVSLRSPHVDEYKATPASLLASGDALLAIHPSETVVSYNTWPADDPAAQTKPKIKAVAALLQHDTSAIVTLKSSGIDRPSKLDGCKYGSYGARYEGRIVQQMIKNDGGKGEYTELVLPMLGLWNTLLKNECDATWVFMGWEGVEAAIKGVELNVFRLGDYGVAYQYAPVLSTTPEALSTRAEDINSLLAATEKGYQYAVSNPEKAAALFCEAVASEYASTPLPEGVPSKELVQRSLEEIGKDFLTPEGRWGVMDPARWESFLDWLSGAGLLTTKVQSRAPKEGLSTSLDGLRAGDVGEVIPREAVSASDMMVSVGY